MDNIRRLVVEALKTSRPAFWPTHLWFYLLPFAGRDVFGSVPFWAGAVYVCFPLGILAYGWNDLGDTESDRLNPRKNSWLFGAQPNNSLQRRLPWIITLTQLPFMVAFIWLAGIKMAGWFAALVFVNVCYNTLGFKRLPVIDLLNQAGYLLIFVLASWLCDVPQLNGPIMIFSAIFAMQSHLFGQLMDIDEDRQAGRRSTAVVIGVLPAKILLVAIMVVLTSIAYVYFRGPTVAIFMAAGTSFFFLDACFGPRRYPTWLIKGFFVSWNIVVILTMHLVWRYDVFLTE